MTGIEAYYQALTFKRMWLKFRNYAAQHGSKKAYDHAVFCFKMYQRSCAIAGI